MFFPIAQNILDKKQLVLVIYTFDTGSGDLTILINRPVMHANHNLTPTSR